MIVLQILEAYFAIAGLFSIVVVALLCHFRPGDPLRLLDGRQLGSVLDDRDRHLLDVALAEDAVVSELDALYDAPAFGGWCG